MLYQNGFKSPEEVARAEESTLSEIEGLGPDKAGSILKAVRAFVEAKQQEAEAAAAAAEEAGEVASAATDMSAPSEEGKAS